MKKAVKCGIGLIVIGGCIWAGVKYWSSAKPAEMKEYYTEPIAVGDVTDSISATGTVEPEELINVGAQVQGMIQWFGKDISGKSIDYGSHVKAGMVLAHVDDTLYAADVKSAEAALQQKKSELAKTKADLIQQEAKLRLAEQDLKRAEILKPAGAMAQAAYDSALSIKEVADANIDVVKAEILQAEAACRAAEATLARAKSNLNYCTITSPVDGVVIDRRVNIGQTVVSSMSTPSLFLIAKDLKKMQVWVSVNEADIGRIKPGMEVQFTVDAFPGEIFAGTVGKIRLNASLTQNVVTYVVEVQADNSNLRLLPYLTANTRFIVRQVKNSMVVPNSALRWVPSKAFRKTGKDGKGQVWTLDSANQPVPHEVQILITDGIHSAVKTDLPEGTKLITGIAAAAAAAGNEEVSSPFLPKMKPPKR